MKFNSRATLGFRVEGTASLQGMTGAPLSQSNPVLPSGLGFCGLGLGGSRAKSRMLASADEYALLG